MKVLIVTGGIGSGKSYICRMLAEKYAIPVYEADKRVKALYTEQPVMLDRIEDLLGYNFRNDAGEFVPQSLAEVIFNDPVALDKVEDVVFPYLKNDFSVWAQSQVKGIVAFESATVLEKSQFAGFGDIVLLVDAPTDMRALRASLRDGVDTEKIKVRMASQPLMNKISAGFKCSRVDYILSNVSTLSDLEQKLDEFIEKYAITKML